MKVNLYLIKMTTATEVASISKVIFNNEISIYYHSSNEYRIKLYL